MKVLDSTFVATRTDMKLPSCIGKEEMNIRGCSTRSQDRGEDFECEKGLGGNRTWMVLSTKPASTPPALSSSMGVLPSDWLPKDEGHGAGVGVSVGRKATVPCA